MSSDPFTLLGLDRKTATEADIRKAYAERLKVTRPEDDRAAFIKLREAYERARIDAYQQSLSPNNNTEAGLGEFDQEPFQITYAKYSYDDYYDDFELTHPIAQELTAVFTDPKLKHEELLDHLKNIIAAVEADGIEAFGIARDAIREFLCENTGLYGERPTISIPTDILPGWMDIDISEYGSPTLIRPPWLTLDVFDTLNDYFQWTFDRNADRWSYIETNWLQQLQLELIWAEMPVADAGFNRFEFLLHHPVLKPSPDKIIQTILSCPKGTEENEARLEASFRQLILAETGYDAQSPTLNLPDWLTYRLFNSLERRFKWQPHSAHLTKAKTGRRKISAEARKEITRQFKWLEQVQQQLQHQSLPEKNSQKWTLRRLIEVWKTDYMVVILIGVAAFIAAGSVWTLIIFILSFMYG
jgi:hypothetical protein